MVKMKLEQKIVALYTVIGVIAGTISNYLATTSTLLAVVAAVVIYFGTSIPLMKGKDEKTRKKIAFNSGMTIFLVWATVWVFLYNL